MTYITTEGEPQPPVGEVGIIYLGPVAPHWEVRLIFGDPQMLESFRDRIYARLMLLPPHDPQFRRNRERIISPVGISRRNGVRVRARQQPRLGRGCCLTGDVEGASP